ncbi:hypothetical protein AAC387_Pa10g0400 [Persea americana]
MGSEADADPRSTPKLSFYSLPPKPYEPTGMLTPPLRPPASVPFLWEEAPGKPRTCGSDFKPASARSLDLPPRLLSEIRITNLPSPTTVLDGPYVVRSASCSSINFKSSISPEREKWHLGLVGGATLRKEKDGLVGFWRKKVKRGNGRLDGSLSSAASISGVDDGEVGFGFNSSSSSGSDVGSRCRGKCGDDESQVKITRFRRNKSLLNVSNASTHLWATIYGSLRHVVPWRVRKLKKDALP